MSRTILHLWGFLYVRELEITEMLVKFYLTQFGSKSASLQKLTKQRIPHFQVQAKNSFLNSKS